MNLFKKIAEIGGFRLFLSFDRYFSAETGSI
jgi:hypothetical protein